MLFSFGLRLRQERMTKLNIYKTDLFHVHTYRCKHAEEISDEAYVKKAIAVGASGILFADHSPFPGNPFGNRMDMEQLPEYLDTIGRLKERYADKISIHAGLEVEYLPSFHSFYEKLRDTPLLDFMMIGQHMYEVRPGTYSFQLSPAEKNRYEHIGCAEAMIQGIESGLFDIIAHPDRCFKRQKEWTEDMTALSRNLIASACAAGVKLEKNLESMARKRYFREEFWCLVPDTADIVIGTDAHSVDDMVKKWDIQQLLFCEESDN